MGNQFVSCTNRLLECGYSIDAVVDGHIKFADIDDFLENTGFLISKGAKIDVGELVSKLAPWRIAKNLKALMVHGANIDINELISKLSSDEIINYLETLMEHGADINTIVSTKLCPFYRLYMREALNKHGAGI